MSSDADCYRLSSFVPDLAGLHVEQASEDLTRPLGAHEVRVRIHSVSLNARDLQICSGTYPAPVLPPAGLVPCSDGAGAVLAVGAAVREFRAGDRVVTHLSEAWQHGELGNEMQQTALGGGRDGVLRKVVVLNEQSLLPIPDGMSYAEASCLPVAGLTAYHCLFGFERTLAPGQVLLVQGTGGVSMAALQLALSVGARAVVLSSSDAKLSQCVEMGVKKEECINYRRTPQWHARVRELVPRGVDHTIEIGGRDTILQAIQSTAPYGCVWVVGYMSDYGKAAASAPGELDVAKAILYSQAIVRGVLCGSRALFRTYLAAHAARPEALRPLVARSFAFAEAKAAFEYLREGAVGKVVVRCSE